MNRLRKKYFLDNINDDKVIRKIEIELFSKFQNTYFRVDYDNYIIIIDLLEEDIELEIEKLKRIIKEVDNSIDVVEREVKKTYKRSLILQNLDCANCAAKIERIAKRTLDYEFIAVDFTSTRFIIETTSEDLINNLETEVKYIARQVDSNINVISNLKKEINAEASEESDNSRTKKFILGIIIFLGGFIFKTLVEKYGFTNENLKLLIIYLTYISGYILIAGDVLYSAFSNAKSGRVFDEKFLMSIATITALVVGFYDEAVFVMIFYKVGEFLQQYAVNYSRRSIASLVDIKPQVANVIVDQFVTEMDPQDVVIGDIIVVKPGDKIPLDGVVIKGEASLDSSALTGESILRDVKEGDNVLSGSINVNGNLQIKVTKIYEDSLVSKILDLVENASSHKAKSENFISKFAKYYTPTVVIVALVLAVLLPFILPTLDLTWVGGFKKSIMTALIFLVVSCPCALVISIPLGFFGGIGGASRHGILVKGSNYLEALNFVDTFVFDKTGTLTTGEFVVEEVISTSEYSNEEVLKFAAHAETGSNHLIALSIINKFGKDNIDYTVVEAEKLTSNLGVSAVVNNLNVLVGRGEFLEEKNIEFKEIDNPGIIVYVAVETKCIGYLIIYDEIRKNTADAIKELKDYGINRTIILTGDKEEIAAKISREANIDEYYFDMTPVDKVERFSQIKSSMDLDKKIAYVGDGINDAPVLGRADIGIAMGALGSDAAIEVADIVLMTDDLSKLTTAMKIAKKTRKIVIQNVILALVVKFSVLLLAILEPILIGTRLSFMFNFLIYEAIFADVGVSVIAIINSLRAMKVEWWN